MPPEPLRVVTDRWEWASLAHQAPTVYHTDSWTMAALRHIRAGSTVATAFAYLRCWTPTGALVCCPIIRLGDRWVNTPRACPLTVLGHCPDPVATLHQAIAAVRPPSGKAKDRDLHIGRLDIHDDADQVIQIEQAGHQLAGNSASTRIYRDLDTRVVNQIARTVAWDTEEQAIAWLVALRCACRFGDWNVELRAYHDDSDVPLGWAVWCTRAGIEQCIATAQVAARPLAWRSAR